MLAFTKVSGWLLSLLCLAGAIRFVGLAENPPGLFRDEADKAYTTYSLLETGKDLAGRSWPLQIKALGVYSSPLYHWFSLPVVGVLGVNVWSTRLIAALAGTCACIGVYLLGREMAGIRAGLLAAVLLAVSPWHFLFSRWANQGILMTLFLPLAAWATWKAVHAEVGSRVWGWVLFAGACWALAWIAYDPARLFVPLFLFALLGIELLRGTSKGIQLPSPGGKGTSDLEDLNPPHLTSPARGEELDSPLPRWEGLGEGGVAAMRMLRPVRSRGITILSIGAVTVLLILPFLINTYLRWDETQTRLKFLAGEQPFNFIATASNYLAHWDPRYLLLFGDANPRHHAFARTGFGQLTWLEALACLAGGIALAKQRGRAAGWLLAWLLLAPVPAALTHEGLPHALRTLMIVPAFEILGGIGLASLTESIAANKKRLAEVGIGAAFLVQSAISLFLFSTEYPETSGPYWEAGTLEAIELVEKARRDGEVCLVSGLIEYPETFFQFVLLPDPEIIQEGGAIEGYAFIPTGSRFDAGKSEHEGLFLLRPGEVRKPPDWVELRPQPPDRKLERSWRLYRR